VGTRPACLLIRAIHGSVGDGELGESNPQDPPDPIRKIVKRSLKFARARERERERERERRGSDISCTAQSDGCILLPHPHRTAAWPSPCLLLPPSMFS
jgi:hypothetical protein